MKNTAEYATPKPTSRRTAGTAEVVKETMETDAVITTKTKVIGTVPPTAAMEKETERTNQDRSKLKDSGQINTNQPSQRHAI